ncbi:MAG: class I SAM-dependent methyltransferase [Blastocatellales bacterium]
MSEIAYHLLEFEIARAGDDPRRVMPVLSDRDGSILDIGCGAGQTLITCDLKPGAFACGVDVDEEALALGKRMSRGAALARASGERLPFPDQSFDVVISRVALPYMHIPGALREIARVLKPGGQVWFMLHSISMVLRGVARSLRELNAKSLIYQHYVIANGLLFHFTGRQFRCPFNHGKCESFQTASGIVRAMRAAGFDEVRAECDGFFIVTASKQG